FPLRSAPWPAAARIRHARLAAPRTIASDRPSHRLAIGCDSSRRVQARLLALLLFAPLLSAALQFHRTAGRSDARRLPALGVGGRGCPRGSGPAVGNRRAPATVAHQTLE